MNVRLLLISLVAGSLLGTTIWWLLQRDGADAAALATEAPQPAALSYHDGVMRAAPSVVSVYASSSRARRGGARRLDTTQGSGVIVAADGLIVTNRHLIDGADVINVTLPDGRSVVGQSVGDDAETDLALVRVDAQGLPALALDGSPAPRVGDIVLAIGNPFDVGQTVTQGIVSAIGRRVAGGSAWQNFVQIDAAINPGNSGGALINTRGELLGVNTAVFSGTRLGDREGVARGIGYAIPVQVLSRVVPALLADGRVARGWLGISVVDAPRIAASSSAQTPVGALVNAVAHDGPANAAGVRPGDIIEQVEDVETPDARTLLLEIAARAPGSEVELHLRRASAATTLSVRLGERDRPAVPTVPTRDASPPDG